MWRQAPVITGWVTEAGGWKVREDSLVFVVGSRTVELYSKKLSQKERKEEKPNQIIGVISKNVAEILGVAVHICNYSQHLGDEGAQG